MVDYRNLLPPPLAADERFVALAEMLNDWQRLDVDLIRTLGHIAQADALQLQHFAEWFSLSEEPAWSYAEDIEARRILAAGAVLIHRRKGTPWAVKEIIRLIGLGENTRVIEGGRQRQYDGQVYADGSQLYSGAAWAEYSVEVDLGETSGLDSGTGGRIRDVLSGIAPARCHLNELTWCLGVADSVSVSEATTLEVSPQVEEMIERPRYDGKYRHDAAIETQYNGQVLADGSAAYKGWKLKASPLLYGEEDSVVLMELAMSLSDRIGRYQLYDGNRIADGSMDHGENIPVCIEEVELVQTKHIRYNGRYTYDGSTKATGDIKTVLETAA